MSYCTAADVSSVMGIDAFSASTTPTEDEVTEAIDGVSGELDGVAQAAGYEVPIVGTAALALLKRYAKFGAAAQAWHTAYQANDEPSNVKYWRETYENFIARLRRDEQQLPAEVATSEEDIAFGVAPAVQRDRYWLTGEALDNDG